jgi:hypothetical protein
MADFAYEDPILGPCIVTFDGHVFELFTEREASKARLIASMLHVQIDDPDRRGRRDVWFTCGPGRSGGGCRLTLPAGDWSRFEPWLADVVAASG